MQPSGQKALLSGDNSTLPPLDFLEDQDQVRPGDRVVTSGDGGVFPADLLVGQVALGSDKRLRVLLSADYGRLEFLRVLRSHELEPITDPGGVVAPPLPPALPEPLAETPNGEPPLATPGTGTTGDVINGDPGESDPSQILPQSNADG